MAAEFDWDAGTAKQMMLDIASRFKSVKNGQKEITGIFSKVVIADVMDHFKNEQGENAYWAAWSPSYRAHMERIGKGGRNILQTTGRLRNSFKPGNVRKIGGDLVWFNNAQTAKGFPYAD